MDGTFSLFLFFAAAAGRRTVFRDSGIEFRIHNIEVSGIQMFLRDPQGFAESLEMDHFSRPQKAQRIRHIGIFHNTKQVVVGCACLLLCCNRTRTTFG